jgi:PAS domain S-box-containing protein
MVRGESGRAAYEFDWVEQSGPRIVRKHVYFTPVRLENTFWSIAVTAPEEEALMFIRGFRNRWILGMAILMMAFGVWGFFLARTMLQLNREEARRIAQEGVLQAELEREEALRDSEERFRTYFEDSLLAMAITSPDRNWLVVNERLTHLLGYSKEELRTRTVEQLTHPRDVHEDRRQFARVLAGEADGYSREMRFVRRDGSIAHAIFSVRLVRGPDGAPDYCLVQLQDITDRKALDEEKARLGEQLRQAQKLEAIGQLAGGVAHDYNNLLTVQLGHLSLLREGPPLPPDVDESLREIERSARMAAQLTRQLLAFSRRQVLQKQRLDLNDVLENLLRMLRRILPEDIMLELNPAPESLWLDADAGMMEQVVMNLVVNARDAMPGGGRLTLSTQAVTFSAESLPPAPDARPGDYACLVVADTGEGMDAVTRARIFEPFFTTKDPSKGTGLGLATVYGIVKQHSGWIEVESAEQRGTVIRVYYPAATADAESGADQLHERASPLHGDGQTILVAEDNPAVRQTLTTSLQRLNYAVLAAAGTAEALGLWQAHHRTIALLLTDMVMRDGDNGLELARALRVDRPELPIVIMSGYSQDLVSGGLDADMVFLPKPWTTEVLSRTLQQCLSAPNPGP